MMPKLEAGKCVERGNILRPARCLSACTLLFAAGVEREIVRQTGGSVVIEKSALFSPKKGEAEADQHVLGFHALKPAFREDASGGLERQYFEYGASWGQMQLPMVENYLVEMGLDKSALAFYVPVRGGDATAFRYPSMAELNRSRFLASAYYGAAQLSTTTISRFRIPVLSWFQQSPTRWDRRLSLVCIPAEAGKVQYLLVLSGGSGENFTGPLQLLDNGGADATRLSLDYPSGVSFIVPWWGILLKADGGDIGFGVQLFGNDVQGKEGGETIQIVNNFKRTLPMDKFRFEGLDEAAKIGLDQQKFKESLGADLNGKIRLKFGTVRIERSDGRADYHLVTILPADFANRILRQKALVVQYSLIGEQTLDLDGSREFIEMISQNCALISQLGKAKPK
jgi:hypothetical protein